MSNEQYIQFYQINIPVIGKIVDDLRKDMYENAKWFLRDEYNEKQELLDKMKNNLKKRKK